MLANEKTLNESPIERELNNYNMSPYDLEYIYGWRNHTYAIIRASFAIETQHST